MKPILLVLVALTTGHGVLAQTDDCTITLTGQVVDSLNLTPLENTLISVVGIRKFETRTDASGKFSIANICPGQLELHFSHLDCEHLHIHLSLNSDTFVTVYIRHVELLMPGGRITVSKNKDNPNIQQVDKRKIESNRSAGLGQIFQELGSVSLLKTGSSVSKPVVNGLHSNRVIIINNGIRQEGQNWGMEHAPEIDPFLANSVILLKGANTLRYGADGIGGIILVNPASIFQEKSHVISGEINLSGFSNGKGGIASGILGYKLSDKFPLSLRIQGTVKQAGNVMTPGYYLANTGLQEHNYSLHLGYSGHKFSSELFYSHFNTRIGLFSGSQVGNLSDLKLAMSRSQPISKDTFEYRINRPYQNADHQLYKWKANWYKDALNSFEAVLSYQRNHREEYDVLRSANAYTGPVFDYKIGTWMADLVWSRLDVMGFNLKTGLFGLNQSNAYNGRYFIPGFYQNSFAQYFIAEQKKKQRTLEFSIRHDTRLYDLYIWNNNLLSIDKRQFDGFSALLTESFELNKAGKLGFIASSTWRPAAPNELYANGVHQGIASIEIGDKTMKRERAFNLSFFHNYQNKKLNLEYEVFGKWIDGFINLVPGKEPILTVRGAFPSFYYTQGDALLYGFSYGAKYELHRNLDIRIKGNVLNGTDLKRKNYLNQIPPYDGRLELQYHRKAWNIRLLGDYAIKQFRYVDSSDYLPPPKSYLLLGFEITHDLKIRNYTMHWAVSGGNMLNTRYREYLNRFRYFADAPGRNINLRLNFPITINNKKHPEYEHQ